MKLLIFTLFVSVSLNVFFFTQLIHTKNLAFKNSIAYNNAMEYIESQARTHGNTNNMYTCRLKK